MQTKKYLKYEDVLSQRVKNLLTTDGSVYEEYFGLKEKPFKCSPDPDYVYMSAAHKEALSLLIYAITSGDGFTVLTGATGTGKTTMVRVLLANFNEKYVAAHILNPKMDPVGLLKAINAGYGLPAESNEPSILLDKLNRFLLRQKAEGKKAFLIIDEAQGLEDSVLEQLRLLSNLETNTSKLLLIILVGTPELGPKIQSRRMRHLNQRIGVHCHLKPMGGKDTRAYIHYRMQTAATENQAQFTRMACWYIHFKTRGIARRINHLCEVSLMAGYAEQRKKITAVTVAKAVREIKDQHRSSAKSANTSGRFGRRLISTALMCTAVFGGIVMATHGGGAYSQSRQAVTEIVGKIFSPFGRLDSPTSAVAITDAHRHKVAPQAETPNADPLAIRPEAVTDDEPEQEELVAASEYEQSSGANLDPAHAQLLPEVPAAPEAPEVPEAQTPNADPLVIRPEAVTDDEPKQEELVTASEYGQSSGAKLDLARAQLLPEVPEVPAVQTPNADPLVIRPEAVADAGPEQEEPVAAHEKLDGQSVSDLLRALVSPQVSGSNKTVDNRVTNLPPVNALSSSAGATTGSKSALPGNGSQTGRSRMLSSELAAARINDQSALAVSKQSVLPKSGTQPNSSSKKVAGAPKTADTQQANRIKPMSEPSLHAAEAGNNRRPFVQADFEALLTRVDIESNRHDVLAAIMRLWDKNLVVQPEFTMLKNDLLFFQKAASANGFSIQPLLCRLDALKRTDKPCILEIFIPPSHIPRYVALKGLHEQRAVIIAGATGGDTVMEWSQLEPYWSGAAYIPQVKP